MEFPFKLVDKVMRLHMAIANQTWLIVRKVRCDHFMGLAGRSQASKQVCLSQISDSQFTDEEVKIEVGRRDCVVHYIVFSRTCRLLVFKKLMSWVVFSPRTPHLQ